MEDDKLVKFNYFWENNICCPKSSYTSTLTQTYICVDDSQWQGERRQ